MPDSFERSHINLHELGVDGRGKAYDMKDVTGLDMEVQARLLSQPVFLRAVWEAVQMLERHPATEDFAFVCRSGTHRSVGAISLLAMVMYPNADVCLHTKRTLDDARSKGLM